MAEPIATLAGLAPALRGRALRKVTRQACAGARPSESLRAQLSGGGLLSMRALRLSQALALGCRGLALRDAAGIFPAAQRRSIGDFLGVDAAKSAAWSVAPPPTTRRTPASAAKKAVNSGLGLIKGRSNRPFCIFGTIYTSSRRI